MNHPSSSLDWGLHQSKKRSPCPCPQRVPLRQVPFKKGTEISASRNQRVLEPLHSHDSLLKGDGYETIASAIPHRGMKFGKIKLASTYVQESMNRITKSLFIDLLKFIPFGNNVLVCNHIGISLSSLMKREYTMITNTINNNCTILHTRSIGFVENRVVLQSIGLLESFGVPTEVVTLALRNVLKAATCDSTFADLDYLTQQCINTRTPSEGIDRTTKGDE